MLPSTLYSLIHKMTINDNHYNLYRANFNQLFNNRSIALYNDKEDLKN